MTTSPRAIRRATTADAKAIERILADSFQDDPPLMWIIPDPDDRRRLSPGFFRPFVDIVLATGEAHITEGQTGAAMWLDVDIAAAAEEDSGELRQFLVSGIGAEYAEQFFVLDSMFSAKHPNHESHDYLLFVGVIPLVQNQGVGGGLLSHRLVGLDEAGRAAYVEASSPRNAALYARLGFSPMGDPIKLPDGPALYPMWRPPASG